MGWLYRVAGVVFIAVLIARHVPTTRISLLLRPAGTQGPQIMSAFEKFLEDNPEMADKPYGAAIAETLKKAFPCSGQGT
jgi:hypothetical protein